MLRKNTFEYEVAAKSVAVVLALALAILVSVQLADHIDPAQCYRVYPPFCNFLRFMVAYWWAIVLAGLYPVPTLVTLFFLARWFWFVRKRV